MRPILIEYDTVEVRILYSEVDFHRFCLVFNFPFVDMMALWIVQHFYGEDQSNWTVTALIRNGNKIIRFYPRANADPYDIREQKLIGFNPRVVHCVNELFIFEKRIKNSLIKFNIYTMYDNFVLGFMVSERRKEVLEPLFDTIEKKIVDSMTKSTHFHEFKIKKMNDVEGQSTTKIVMTNYELFTYFEIKPRRNQPYTTNTLRYEGMGARIEHNISMCQFMNDMKSHFLHHIALTPGGLLQRPSRLTRRTFNQMFPQPPETPPDDAHA